MFNIKRKNKNYIVTIITRRKIDHIQVVALNKKKALNLTKEVLLKCDMFNYKSENDFKLICRKMKR